MNHKSVVTSPGLTTSVFLHLTDVFCSSFVFTLLKRTNDNHWASATTAPPPHFPSVFNIVSAGQLAAFPHRLLTVSSSLCPRPLASVVMVTSPLFPSTPSSSSFLISSLRWPSDRDVVRHQIFLRDQVRGTAHEVVTPGGFGEGNDITYTGSPDNDGEQTVQT